ncbi:MAG: aldose epimerase family protein [Lawsonibacter sp.]
MTITEKEFGETGRGEPVTEYTLKNRSGGSVSILNYGCTVRCLQIPDATGRLTDVVLGYDTIWEYEEHDGYLGAIIGRNSNRIGAGSVTLNGTEYSLSRNEGNNQLHGGQRGFDKRMWTVQAVQDGIRLSRCSPDGEEGFPGNLEVSITYCLLDEPALRITYDAVSDADTICNLTSHCYFNLNGGGSALAHNLQIVADQFTENNGECLPTGKIFSVSGTPMDFRVSRPLGNASFSENEQLRQFGGYDHNYVLRGGFAVKKAAVLESLQTGLRMTVLTDRPGMQLYSGNSLTVRTGKNGVLYHPHDAVCLETQLFPNAMQCVNFPSPVLKHGATYHSQTEYRFSPTAT